MTRFCDAQDIHHLELEIDFSPPDNAVTSPVYRIDGQVNIPSDLPVKKAEDGRVFIDNADILREWLRDDSRTPDNITQRRILSDSARRDARNQRRSTPREVYAVLQECACVVTPLSDETGYAIRFNGIATQDDLHVMHIYGLRRHPDDGQLSTADPWLLRLIVPERFANVNPADWMRAPGLTALPEKDGWLIEGVADTLHSLILSRIATRVQDGWRIADLSHPNLPPFARISPPTLFDDDAFLNIPLLPSRDKDGNEIPALVCLRADETSALLITHRLPHSTLLHVYELSTENPETVIHHWRSLLDLRALAAETHWNLRTDTLLATVPELLAGWRDAHPHTLTAMPLPQTAAIPGAVTHIPDASVGNPAYQTLPQTYVGDILSVGKAVCLGAAWRWDADLKRNVIVYLSCAATGTTCDALWARLMIGETLNLETPTGGHILGRSAHDYQRIRKYVQAIGMPHLILIDEGVTNRTDIVQNRVRLHILAATRALAARRLLDKLSCIVKLPLYDWDNWLFDKGCTAGLIEKCEVLGNFVCFSVSTDTDRWTSLVSQAAVTFGLPDPNLPFLPPQIDPAQ